MKEIELTQGYLALIDDDDYEIVKDVSWRVFKRNDRRTKYARGWAKVNGKFKSILLHRMILGLPHYDKRQADHINGDGLDNRRENLRICTNRQNAQNRKKRQGCLSKFKGVVRHGKKWRVQIWKDGVKMGSKVFGTEEEAAKAYDVKAVELFGEFANTNF